MSRVFIRSTELGLLIVAAIAFAATLASFELSQGATLSVQFLYYVGGFVGVFAVAHIALTIWAPYADQVMLPVVSLLNGLGLIMVYRIDAAKDLGLANRQIMWSVVGVALLIAVLIIVRDHKVLTRYSYLLGALGLVLLALPLVWPTSINADARICVVDVLRPIAGAKTRTVYRRGLPIFRYFFPTSARPRPDLAGLGDRDFDHGGIQRLRPRAAAV